MSVPSISMDKGVVMCNFAKTYWFGTLLPLLQVTNSIMYIVGQFVIVFPQLCFHLLVEKLLKSPSSIIPISQTRNLKFEQEKRLNNVAYVRASLLSSTLSASLFLI